MNLPIMTFSSSIGLCNVDSWTMASIRVGSRIYNHKGSIVLLSLQDNCHDFVYMLRANDIIGQSLCFNDTTMLLSLWQKDQDPPDPHVHKHKMVTKGILEGCQLLLNVFLPLTKLVLYQVILILARLIQSFNEFSDLPFYVSSVDCRLYFYCVKPCSRKHLEGKLIILHLPHQCTSLSPFFSKIRLATLWMVQPTFACLNNQKYWNRV